MACESSPNGAIVYGPSVAGGAAVPGEPSKTISPVVQSDPVHVNVSLIVLPEAVLVFVCPLTLLVCVAVQLPELWHVASKSELMLGVASPDVFTIPFCFSVTVSFGLPLWFEQHFIGSTTV